MSGGPPPQVEGMDEPAVKVVIESDTRRLALLKEAEELQKLDTADALARQREVRRGTGMGRDGWKACQYVGGRWW